MWQIERQRRHNSRQYCRRAMACRRFVYRTCATPCWFAHVSPNNIHISFHFCFTFVLGHAECFRLTLRTLQLIWFGVQKTNQMKTNNKWKMKKWKTYRKADVMDGHEQYCRGGSIRFVLLCVGYIAVIGFHSRWIESDTCSSWIVAKWIVCNYVHKNKKTPNCHHRLIFFVSKFLPFTNLVAAYNELEGHDASANANFFDPVTSTVHTHSHTHTV